jgi:signal peptidase II
MFRTGLLIALVVVIADQLSKFLLIDFMAGRSFRPLEVAPIFDLVMVWNRGASFGLFASESQIVRWVFVALSVAVSIGLGVWLKRAERWWLAVALGLVIGGAVGNVIDRVTRGMVADFFSFHLGAYYWPAFNVADMAIVAGVGVLLYDSLFLGEKSLK